MHTDPYLHAYRSLHTHTYPYLHTGPYLPTYWSLPTYILVPTYLLIPIFYWSLHTYWSLPTYWSLHSRKDIWIPIYIGTRGIIIIHYIFWILVNCNEKNLLNCPDKFRICACAQNVCEACMTYLYNRERESAKETFRFCKIGVPR